MMWQHDHRVLNDFSISPAEWALLFSASYYIPVAREEFIELAISESDGDISEQELNKAFDHCLGQGWLGYSFTDHPDDVRNEFVLSGTTYPEEGIVLTNRGAALKERIDAVLMETVPLA